ncbi:hypothetical protein QTP86_031382, partial [Hemibagrus guttatus]
MKIRAAESSSPKKRIRTSGRLFLHLDKVETLRCFWELKLTEFQGHFQQNITGDVEYEHGELPERKRHVAPEQHVRHGFLPVAQALGFTFLPQETQILEEILVILTCTAARIRFKTLTLAHKAKNGPTPSYLKALVTPRTAPRSLKSTSTARLVPTSLRVRIESLSSKMDTLISIQEKVLSRLDSMSEELVGIERDMETLKVDKEETPPTSHTKGLARGIGGEMKEMCQEMNNIMTAVNERSEQQTKKLEGMERLVMSIQQVVSFIGETVKTSKITELMFKEPAARKSKTMLSSGVKTPDSKHGTKRQASGEPILVKLKDHKFKEGKEKSHLSFKGLKALKKKKPPDTTGNSASVKKQALLLEEVQKLNRENAERSISSTGSEAEEPLSQNLLDFILDKAKDPAVEQEELLSDSQESVTSPELKEEEEKAEEPKTEDVRDKSKEEEEVKEVIKEESKEEERSMVKVIEEENAVTPQSCENEPLHEVATISEPCESEKGLELQACEKDSEEMKENEKQMHVPQDLCGVFKADGVEIHLDFSKINKTEEGQFDDDECEQFFIDCTPPPPAPFSHRVVSAKPNQISNFYTINHQEIIGGGRFGQVHKCIENSSGLTLAAKIIKARSPKEKDAVKNEIQVMNQLDHANLIQLYAAYESRTDVILVLEYSVEYPTFLETLRGVLEGAPTGVSIVFLEDFNAHVGNNSDTWRGWKEYFEDLLNPTDTPSVEEPEAEDSEVDSFITQAEVTEVVQQLLGGKALGVDEIREYLKSLDVVGLSWLTRLGNIAWQSGTVALDWVTGVVIPLFKKGDRRVCSKYRGITLLSLPGKVYSRVLERRVLKQQNQMPWRSDAMVLDRKNVSCTLQVGGEVLPQVEEFKYLGVLFTSEGRMDREIDRRIGAAAALMCSMYWSVVVKKELSQKAKLLIYQSIYVPTLTYGYELWVMTERDVSLGRCSRHAPPGRGPGEDPGHAEETMSLGWPGNASGSLRKRWRKCLGRGSVNGGELFDRIIDENYTLTELDTIMFVRQICEGLRYMHKMYIIHLDLKPENILCISRVTNKIKIIDFGLARKYIPREKLRVNFGTPEFLAPEVINYDFVSFNTDMWSLGVIVYMLLSGLSPFLGDDDNETLNNILACHWNFEESEFLGISDEAKDFISKLLVYNKSWRIGASESLKHPWLSDPLLHHHLYKKVKHDHTH